MIANPATKLMALAIISLVVKQVVVAQDAMQTIAVAVFEQRLKSDQAYLTIVPGLPTTSATAATTPAICDGLPAIMVRSTKFASNGGCFINMFPNTMISCSCITEYGHGDDVWEFSFANAKKSLSEPLSLWLTRDQVYNVSALVIAGLPPNLKSLKLRGMGSQPLPLEIFNVHLVGASTNVAIVQSTEDTLFQDMFIDNIDLSGLIPGPGFVPRTVKNLTMTRCGLKQLAANFLDSLEDLQSLDVSSNALETIYPQATQEKCESTPCQISAINASSNNIDTFPSQLLVFPQLKSLSLEKNSFESIPRLSQSEFDTLKRLTTLEVDSRRIDCSIGEEHNVLGATVCVSYNSSAAVTGPVSTADEESEPSSFLLYCAIGCCLAAGVLIALLFKRSGSHQGQPYRREYTMNTMPTVSTSATTIQIARRRGP